MSPSVVRRFLQIAVTYMPILPDTEPISHSPAEVTKTPGSVAHKKLRFKLQMFLNSKII